MPRWAAVLSILMMVKTVDCFFQFSGLTYR
jgi:hypothetical protein